MVKIPTIEPGATPIRTISPEAPKRVGAEGRALQVIGEAVTGISDIMEKFRQAQELNETTRAETEAMLGFKELETEASTTPDIWNIKQFDDRIGKIRESTSKGISSTSGKNRFHLSFDSTAGVARASIQKILRIRQMDTLKADMLQNIDTLGDRYASADTVEGRNILKKQRDTLLKEAKDLGYIKAVDAFKIGKISDKDWTEKDVRNKIATDPEIAKEMLTEGLFGPLTADETAKWMQVADQRISNNEKTAKDELEKLWADNLGNVLENAKTMSVEDLIGMVARDEIDPAEGNKLIKWKTDKDRSEPWGQYETDKTIWTEMIRDSVRLDIDLHKFLKRINDAVSKEQINADEAFELVIRVRPLFETAIANKSRPSRFHHIIGTTIDMFKSWAELTPEPSLMVFHMTKELVKGIRDGKITEGNIEEEGQKIVEDAQKVLNPNRTKYKVGDIITNPKTGKNYKVTGFDIDGEPLVDEIR